MFSYETTFSLYIRTVFHNTPSEQVKHFQDEFLTVIEWKFECPACRRFVKNRFEDFLLKIPATEQKTFESHLNFFLENKACICGQRSSTKPQLKKGRDSFEIKF